MDHGPTRIAINGLRSASSPDPTQIEVIKWWERRCIPYDLALGGIAGVSLLALYVFMTAAHELTPGEDAVEPMALVVAPFLVTLCYTLGWVVHLSIRSVCPELKGIGPILFVCGSSLSIFVVLGPGCTWCLICCYRAIQ